MKMMNENPYNKPVTESDFRMPEFQVAKVEDYERRSNGTIARKDRWKTGMIQIAQLLKFNSSGDEYTIDHVVAKVTDLAITNPHRTIEQEIEDLINRANKEGINIIIDTRPIYAKDYDMFAENNYWKTEKKKHV